MLILNIIFHLLYIINYVSCLRDFYIEVKGQLLIDKLDYKLLYKYPGLLYDAKNGILKNLVTHFIIFYGLPYFFELSYIKLFIISLSIFSLKILLVDVVENKLSYNILFIIFRYSYYLYFTGPIIVAFYPVIHIHSQLIVLWLLKELRIFDLIIKKKEM